MTSTEDKVRWCKEYFKDLLTHQSREKGDSPITGNEVNEAVKQFLGGRDELCLEFFKTLDIVGFSWLTYLCTVAGDLGWYVWIGRLG